jgi:hypothetical protein
MSRKKTPEKAGIDQKKLIELIVKAMANNPRQPLNYKQMPPNSASRRRRRSRPSPRPS